jgi:hypothetical protein
MNFTAVKNVCKNSSKDPDFFIYVYREHGKKKGVMYKRRTKSGISNFHIHLFDQEVAK